MQHLDAMCDGFQSSITELTQQVTCPGHCPGGECSPAGPVLRSAESRREPAKAEKKKPESADDVADLAEWWGETGGDKARSDIQAAKQREEKKMPKDVKKQTQQRSKPSATAAPFEPKAKSRLDGSAPAFVPKEPTKEPEVANGGGALDDWSALDEELEKALNEKKSRGGRRR